MELSTVWGKHHDQEEMLGKKHCLNIKIFGIYYEDYSINKFRFGFV